FGVHVVRQEVEEVFARVGAVDVAARDAERAAATEAQPSLRDLDERQVERSASVTTVLRDWTAGDGLAALAVRCWPEFPTELGVCPCSSMSRVADAGTPAACERDVHGALTMLLLEALGSGPTYLVDTVELDEARNLVRLWHCGSAPTVLAADPAN